MACAEFFTHEFVFIWKKEEILTHRTMILAVSSIFLFISLVFYAEANMQVYPMETDVGPLGTAKISVISKSDDVQFINATAKKIILPGDKNEHEIEIDMDSELSLVVAPSKLALAAGSERIVRLISMTPPAKETTWRVYFEGVKDEPQANNSQGNSRSAQVGVSIIWGVLVHVAPQNIVTSIKYDSKTGKVINDGTIRLPLREIGICNNSGSCHWKKETRTVYPDMALTLESGSLQPGNHYRAKYFHWLKKEIEEIEIPASQV